jgi:hypothetical protein
LEAALERPEEEHFGLPKRHYFVPPEGAQEEEDPGWGEEIGFSEEEESGESIDRFLVLPQEDVPVHPPLPTAGEPQVDYSRSYILTSNEFVASLEAKATCRNQLLEEARLRKIAAEESKEKRRLEKLDKERKSKERAAERAAKKREKQYWENVKKNGWGDKLPQGERSKS